VIIFLRDNHNQQKSRQTGFDFKADFWYYPATQELDLPIL